MSTEVILPPKIQNSHPFGQLMYQARNSIKPRKMSLETLASMVMGANGKAVSKSFLSSIELGKSPPQKNYPLIMSVVFPSIPLEEWYYAFLMSINTFDPDLVSAMPDDVRESMARQYARYLSESDIEF